MKKVFIFLLVGFLTTNLLVKNTFAQTPTEEVASPEAKLKEVKYKLPYPGMLPDNPLYKLKVLRDKIVLFFTRDPLKKANRHLHMADKEFMMALKLAEKEKLDLSIHTAFKAEHQITLLVSQIRAAAYSPTIDFDHDLVIQAHKAIQKHQEILVGIADRASEDQKKELQAIAEFSKRNDESLIQLEEELEETKEKILEEKMTKELNEKEKRLLEEEMTKEIKD